MPLLMNCISLRYTRRLMRAAGILVACFGSAASASVSAFTNDQFAPARAIPLSSSFATETIVDQGESPLAQLDSSLTSSSVAPTNPFLPPQDSSLSRDGSATMHQLPPAPGGVAAVLSGLLTLGGIGAVRSARNIHLVALPDWYHAGAPAQIGHTVVFDLTCDLLPLCRIQPLGQQSSVIPSGYGGDSPEHWAPQSSPLASAPRGPPQS